VYVHKFPNNQVNKMIYPTYTHAKVLGMLAFLEIWCHHHRVHLGLHDESEQQLDFICQL